MADKKHVFFAGCTGEIGKRLLNNLIAHNQVDEIHLLVRRPLGIENPKVFEHIVDFNKLSELSITPGSSKNIISYCTLGTTIKKAGSKEGFFEVDLEYVVNFAQWANDHNSQQLAVVSSLDADANSHTFYLETKGLMEASVRKLPWETLWILRPSLLTGHREEFRLAEVLGGWAAKLVNPLLIGAYRRYRPISMNNVATALANLIMAEERGIRVLESDQIDALAEK
jgi:nucleoside-diphosphate-sugar epimerase